jgi:hypothetical protein
MTGRPVRLLTAAALAAAASLLTVSAASAGCFSCGESSYAPPVAQYTAPVVYSYSYAAPVTYAAPSCGCGGYAASYQSPMYIVNQGPAYDAPVVGEPEEAAPALDYGYRRAYPYIGGGARWHHRHWHRGYGDRGWGHRGFGYRGLGHRGFGHRGLGFREGYRGFRHGLRYSMRHPIVGPGGMYRPRHTMVGPGGIYRGRHATGFMPQHRTGGGQMHIMRTPGVVHPRMGGPGGKRPGQR